MSYLDPTGFRHCLQIVDHFYIERRIRRANGHYAWARHAVRPARDGQDRITGWFGMSIYSNVCEKTAAALRDRERKLSQLMEMVPSQVWRLTPGGEPTLLNKRIVDFLGPDVDRGKPGTTRLAAMKGAVVPPDDAAAAATSIHGFP